MSQHHATTQTHYLLFKTFAAQTDSDRNHWHPAWRQ